MAEACAGDEALRSEVESLLAEASGGRVFGRSGSGDRARWRGDGADRQPTHDVDVADGPPHGAPNDASRLAPGQRFGPYRIERLLGRGGMGEVYEAEHLEHGRRIALKVLSQRLSDPTDRARFLREGQLAASVSHPHTVYIYSSEEIAGMPVIAMELLPGGTLKDRVEKKGPLAPIEAIDAMLQVISGLEAAHAAGILHRDIKPSNCFVDADGTVKIGDFGLSIPTLARDVTQLTVTGTVQGTPQFASPEQLRGQSLDVRLRHLRGWSDLVLPPHRSAAVRRSRLDGARLAHRDRTADLAARGAAGDPEGACRDSLAVPREGSGASADELSRSGKRARTPRFDRQDARAAWDSVRRRRHR